MAKKKANNGTPEETTPDVEETPVETPVEPAPAVEPPKPDNWISLSGFINPS